jgi:3-phosphoshikimate 1-carboxyvinyltransferase
MILSLPKDTLPKGAPLGAVSIPGSKSISNRALLLAALAKGSSELLGGLEADDTRWMRDALRALGIPVTEFENRWHVVGGSKPSASGPLWLGASGTTLRFLLPWLALCADGPIELQGDVRLFERPLEPLLRPLEAMGAHWEPLPQGARIHPCAPPRSLDLSIDPSLSSQFLTGLALVAAGLPEESRVRWSKPVASPSYLQLSQQWLARFGCESRLGDGDWIIPGGKLRKQQLALPADWSGAAAFLAAAAVTGRKIELSSLDPQDAQGDAALVDILCKAGCEASWTGLGKLSLQGPITRGIQADLTLCPDLGPVLAAVAALAPAPSVLSGLHTLPLKECDRLEASADLVRWLGADVEITEDHTLKIKPSNSSFLNTTFDPRQDHRMAFAAAVGGLRRGGDLKDPNCVNKTFPAFWQSWSEMLTC